MNLNQPAFQKKRDEAYMDEIEMFDAARRGDLDAFNTLILSHQDFLFSLAVRILGDEDVAADAMQATLISVFRKLATFRGGPLKRWLARIMVNACYDELRRKHRQRTAPLKHRSKTDEEMDSGPWMADPTAGPEESCESRELEHAIATCLQSLTPAFRSILVLVDIEEHSYEEAAAILEVPVNTVKSRLARARMRMRVELQRFKNQLPAHYQNQFSQKIQTDLAFSSRGR